MPRYHRKPQAAVTVKEALQNRTVDQLKPLFTLLDNSKQKPTRKNDLISAIATHLRGAKLRASWKQLDELQQAAVAEAVHGPQATFNPQRFAAKYDQQPNWGEADRWGDVSRKPSLLNVFFYNGHLPEQLRQELREFVALLLTRTLYTFDNELSTEPNETKPFRLLWS